MENIKLSNDATQLLEKMKHSFNIYFDDFGIKWVKNVLSALNSSDAVLPVSENDRGSFFYQFVDFHSGAFNEEDFSLLEPSLRAFCGVCGKIESMTDSWPVLEQEPTDSDKRQLIEQLEKFLSILPSSATFNGWIKQSIENLAAVKK